MLKANFKASWIHIRGEIFGSSGLTCALISENLIQTFCLYLPILELLTIFNDLHSLQSIYLYGIVYHFEYLEGTFNDLRSVQTSYIFRLCLKDFGRSNLLAGFCLRVSVVPKISEGTTGRLFLNSCKLIKYNRKSGFNLRTKRASKKHRKGTSKLFNSSYKRFCTSVLPIWRYD